MALEIITEPLSGANCYVSLDEANAYFDYRLYSDSWTESTSGTQIQALVTATNDIDIFYEFYGSETYEGQSLDWPRDGVTDCEGNEIDSESIPEEVKDATCEHALYILNQNIEANQANLNKGIKSATVDKLKVEYHGGASASSQIEKTSDKVRALLKCLGESASKGWHRLIRR